MNGTPPASASMRSCRFEGCGTVASLLVLLVLVLLLLVLVLHSARALLPNAPPTPRQRRPLPEAPATPER